MFKNIGGNHLVCFYSGTWIYDNREVLPDSHEVYGEGMFTVQTCEFSKWALETK